MKNLYQSELDQIRLTEESKGRLIQSLHGREKPARTRAVRGWRRTVIAAAAVCVLIVSVSAAALIVPVLGEYYQNSKGYQQSSVVLEKSITKNGWTMTLTD